MTQDMLRVTFDTGHIGKNNRSLKIAGHQLLRFGNEGVLKISFTKDECLSCW